MVTKRRETKEWLEEDPGLYVRILGRLMGEVEDRPPSPYEVCREMGLSYGAVLKWVAEEEGRTQEFERALRLRAHLLAEEMVEIADEQGAVASKDGTLLDPNVPRDKLRIQARQWIASKWYRERYGEKVEIEQTHRYVVEVPALAATTQDWVAQVKPPAALPKPDIEDADVLPPKPLPVEHERA